MHVTLLRLACAAVWIAAAVAAAEAAAYYVGGAGASDGNPGSAGAPFATIQRAANAAVAGDTIIVRAGTYAGAKFSTSGTAGAPITLRGETGAIVTSPGPLNSNNDNIWVRDASFVTIEGLEVRSAGRAGIAVQAEPDAESHGVVIRSCFSHDNSRWGIFTAYAEGLLIEGCETSFSAIEHGIYVSNSSDNVTIRNCVAHHNNASGIQINADPALAGDGIISNAEIRNNICYENGVGGGAAINLASVVQSRIQGNLLYDNRASGIAGWDDGFDSAFGTHDNLILNNTIVMPSNGRWAVTLSNGSFNNTVQNNILIHLGTRGSLEVDASSEVGLNSDFNAVNDRFSDGDVFFTLAQWRARGAGHDQSSFIATVSQLFVDQPNDDYHLRTGSPAIDAGTYHARILRDLDGVPRPQGPAFDVGAYEVDAGRRFDRTIGAHSSTSGVFFLRNTNTPGPADHQFVYGPGGLGWRPLAGDWNGDRSESVGLYEPSTSVFYLRNVHLAGPADLQFVYGPAGSGWTPIAGDWNADGVGTVGLYNPSNGVFYLRNANAGGPADLQFVYGPAGLGWKPVVGDWDGDGVVTVGIYDPATSVFHLRNSNGSGPADVAFVYGPAGLGWVPVAGDWDGDGTTTVGLYDASAGVWYLRNSNTAGPADLTFAYAPSGMTPVAGDWDGQ